MPQISIPQVFTGLFFTTSLLALFAPKGLALWFALFGFLSFIQAPGNLKHLLRNHPLGLVIAVGLALGFASVAWSQTPGRTAHIAAILTITSLAALYFFNAMKQAAASGSCIGGAIVAAGWIGVALFGFEIATDLFLKSFVSELTGGKPLGLSYQGHVIKPGLSFFAMLLWPAVLIQYKRRGLRFALTMLGLGTFVLFLGPSMTVQIAAGVSLTVALLVYWLHGTGIKILGVLAVLGTLAAPLLPAQLPDPLKPRVSESMTALPHSALHRIVIWQNTARLIQDAQVLGHGLDTSRSFYGSNDIRKYVYFPDKPDHRWVGEFQPIPLHPHNGILQVWLELGGAGALILACLFLAILWSIARRLPSQVDQAVSAGLLTSVVCIVCLGFGIWQNWLLGAWIIAAGACIYANSAPADGAHEK